MNSDRATDAECANARQRVQRIAHLAPRLVTDFESSPELDGLLRTGDILDVADGPAQMSALPPNAPISYVADRYRHYFTIGLAQWVLQPATPVRARLSDLADATILHCLRRLHLTCDVLVLGSLGSREFGPGSDINLLVLTEREALRDDAEQQTGFLLGLLRELHRLGASLDVDVRACIDDNQGFLVRTHEEFSAYELDGMEMMERFALGNARQLSGSPEALRLVRKGAYGLPLTPERLRRLLKGKRKAETDGVLPQHLRREVKLGIGGLQDIEWLVHILEMRYPESTRAGLVTEMEERIRILARTRLINAFEAGFLGDAHRYLQDLRMRVFLQGFPDDLMPENPAKLDRLAHACGLATANELLARHLEMTEGVRRLFSEGMERLRV